MSLEINKLIEEYTSDMLSWAMYKLPDTETAKDIVQDTFVAVIQNYETFKSKSNPKTWIFSILKNKISDYYRKKYREPEKAGFDDYSNYFNEHGEWIPDKQPANWEDADNNLLDDNNFKKVLKECIENLPKKLNAMINLKFLHEKKADVICKELEISSTNMWQIMHRAKLRLRTCIENNWFKAS